MIIFIISCFACFFTFFQGYPLSYLQDSRYVQEQYLVCSLKLHVMPFGIS